MNLFRFLTDEQLEFVNQSRYEVRFLKGEIIFKQGGPLTHIACLTSGKAKVYIEGSKNKPMRPPHCKDKTLNITDED